MKKYISFLIITVFYFSSTNLEAQNLSPEMEAFITRIDNSNLEELEKELDEGIEGLRAFAGFFSGPDSEGIKAYTREEERFEEPFKIDTLIVNKAILQFDNIGFEQIFRENKTFLKFQKIGNDYWNKTWMGEGMEESFTPKTIFYKDGSKITEGISANEFNFFFEKQWGDIAIIDSVAVDYTINYTKAYDSLLLTKKSKKVNYKEGFIKVEKLEKNYLYLTVSDKYSYGLNVRALNVDGKPLNQNSSSFSATSDGNSEDGLEEILKILEEVQSKLKANKFADTEALKKHLLKKVSKIESAKDKDGVYHKKYYFEGNIESVQVYLETEVNSKTVSFTATNNSGFGEVIFIQSKTENIFLDSNAKELFRTPFLPIQSLGARYFQNDSLYYHLNLKTQKLDELKVAYVWEAFNGLAFIQKTKEDNLLMHDAEHKLLSEIPFQKLYALDKQYVQGIGMQNDNYIISSTGVIKELKDITDIGDLYNGRMAATSNGKFGFITTSGEIAIPFEYNEVENFKDGLAVVANEKNKFGLIDTNGKIIIPLIYSSILSYENGHTWVSTDDAYKLIDNHGKVLITEEGNSYSMVRSGSEITLQFGDKKYDAYGNLISEDKTED